MNREELISAYLDDELSRDERAEIERLLASDIGAQRLCDELRAQREGLNKLPRLAIGQDLTDAVLRAAEQRMLLDPRAPTSPPAETDWLRRAKRPAAWAALVLAVGLLIMLLSPERQPDEVAVAPKLGESMGPATTEPPDEDREAASALAAGSELSDSPAVARDSRELGVPSEPPSAGDAAGADPFRKSGTSLGKGGAGGRVIPKGGAPATDSLGEMNAAPQSAPAPAQSLRFDAPTFEGPPSGTVFICDLSPEAVANNTFAQVLANNQVPLDSADSQFAKTETANANAVETAATDMVVIEATPDQMLGILDELSQQPEQFTVAVAPPPPAEANAAPLAPLQAKDYLNQLPAGGYNSRNRQQSQTANYGRANARVLNRMTQAPGGPLNVETSPQAGPELAQSAAGAAQAAQDESSTRAERQQSADEPLPSYYVMILRQGTAAPAAPQQQATPAAKPAESGTPQP